MDSVVPLIPIDLDRRRHLRLDARAMAAAERALGEFWGKEISIYGALTTVPLRINDIEIILFYALRHEDPTLTSGQVFDLMDRCPIADIMTAITEAWTWATRAAEPQTGEPVLDPQMAVSTGPNSGPMAGALSGSVTTTSGG